MSNKPDMPEMSDFELDEVVGILFGIPPEVEEDTAPAPPTESDPDK